MNVSEQLKATLEEVFNHFKEEMSAIRGSRPTSALVEDIAIDYYGQQTPMKQLGSITLVPPREIQINMWDAQGVKAAEKAISEKLNVNATSEGNIIHVHLPSLTQERRDELIKIVKAKAEDARIKSRTIRDEAKKEADALEKNGKLTQDDKFKEMEKVQKTMDEFNKNVDETIEKKIREISE